jgi:hypothetical protein
MNTIPDTSSSNVVVSTDNNTTKQYKTPLYLRKCVKRYRDKNPDKVKIFNQNYKITDEQLLKYRETHKLKIASMTPEQLQTYRDQRAQYMRNYRLQNKNKHKNNDVDTITIDLQTINL